MYEIIKDLIKNGYFVAERYLEDKALQELQDNCNKLLLQTTSAEKYNFGKALRIDAYGLERNGYLHFDRIWTFKYFYYLTDVMSHANGPLCVAPRSHRLGQKLRSQELHKPYEFQRNQIERDYPEIPKYNHK